jgi:hypothetical protein
MMTAEFPIKFARLESNVAASKGAFTLFALFLLEDAPDRWDLVVSAPWVSDKKAALNYLVERIKTDLGSSELIKLSRIVFVDPDDVAVRNINSEISVEHGSVELRDRTFFGLPIKHAFIFTSKRPEAQVAR